MIEKKYIRGLVIGLILLFQLQVISYINWLMIDQGVINGSTDQFLLLKTPLVVIPGIFFCYFMFGIIKYLSSK